MNFCLSRPTERKLDEKRRSIIICWSILTFGLGFCLLFVCLFAKYSPTNSYSHTDMYSAFMSSASFSAMAKHPPALTLVMNILPGVKSTSYAPYGQR